MVWHAPCAAVLQEGYIDFAGPSPRIFFFEAPSCDLGNLPAFFGGTLCCSQKISPITPQWRGDPNAVSIGSGLTLVLPSWNSPGADRTDHSVGLANPGWRAGSSGSWSLMLSGVARGRARV